MEKRFEFLIFFYKNCFLCKIFYFCNFKTNHISETNQINSNNDFLLDLVVQEICGGITVKCYLFLCHYANTALPEHCALYHSLRDC